MTLPANLPSSCCEGPSSYWRRGQREVLTTVDVITRCSNPNCHRELRSTFVWASGESHPEDLWCIRD